MAGSISDNNLRDTPRRKRLGKSASGIKSCLLSVLVKLRLTYHSTPLAKPTFSFISYLILTILMCYYCYVSSVYCREANQFTPFELNL